MKRKPDIRIKRVYEAPDESDGYRVLVDRLWPRGLKKEAAALDAWHRELAPSDALRRWFGHDVARWPEFRRRYVEELRDKEEALEALRAVARERRLTLLFAARDEAHNDAVVLREVLLSPEATGRAR
ncbi:MAG: DUF488 family protein [Rhodospirillales bacterium]|nr:DUF488 family protein [Rhodospirillales bacterium]